MSSSFEHDIKHIIKHIKEDDGDNGFVVHNPLEEPKETELVYETYDTSRHTCPNCKKGFTILTIVHNITQKLREEFEANDSAKIYKLFSDSNDAILKQSGGLCKKCFKNNNAFQEQFNLATVTNRHRVWIAKDTDPKTAAELLQDVERVDGMEKGSKKKE